MTVDLAALIAERETLMAGWRITPADPQAAVHRRTVTDTYPGYNPPADPGLAVLERRAAVRLERARWAGREPV